MSRTVDDREPGPVPVRDGDADRIGPGRLVLVVGPSGAGKDTLIEGARLACDAVDVVVARRTVTRAASAAEDNAVLSPAEFDRAASRGAFALAWGAHGHRYGVDAAIDAAIAAGRTVVCNVSRTVIDDARRRYAAVVVVEVTAPPDVLATRLAERARASDGDLAGRLRRSTDLQSIGADHVIVNVESREAGIRRLLAIIRQADE